MCKVMTIKSCVSWQLLVKKSNKELTPTFDTNGNELQVESTSNNNREFLSRLNRGWLIEPSDLLFITIKECWSLYSSLFDSADAKSIFLSSSHHLSTFEELFPMSLNRNNRDDDITLIKCKDNYIFRNNLHIIARTMFNLMVGNFVCDTNSLIHQQKRHKRKSTFEASVNDRKLKKLQSEKWWLRIQR